MERNLQHVALRRKALYIPDNQPIKELSGASAYLLLHLSEQGYSLDEETLHAVNSLNKNELRQIIAVLDDVYGTDLSWTSLTKEWLVPTGTTMFDRFVTAVCNAFPEYQHNGTTLPCGHFIPLGVFDLNRYNGCPFCGTIFEATTGINKGGHGRLTVLSRMTDKDMQDYMLELLNSSVPLDATQADSLGILVRHYGLPEDCMPAIRETRTLLAAALYSQDDCERALSLLTTPDDILRMLWYRQSGNTRFKTVKELVSAIQSSHRFAGTAHAVDELKQKLRLHFTRSECTLFARRLNALNMSEQQMCENMHRHREMWVRLIRALRLGEYARRKNLGKLAGLLRRFAAGDYTVYNGEVEKAYIARDAEKCLGMLAKRPGYFARCLFATMLSFGAEKAIDKFETVVKDIPGRLLYSLASNAEAYFMPEGDERFIIIPGAQGLSVPVNAMLKDYSDNERAEMILKVRTTVLEEFKRRYSGMAKGGSMYISKELFEIPVTVSDRSATMQATNAAACGQRFPVKGDKVRLFLHWGQGLPAQHLDMDLSAIILYADGNRRECAYYSLDLPGAVHSGDIQYIPENTGAAEYIELDIPALISQCAQTVIFLGCLYTDGMIPDNTMFGWMYSNSPMTVDNESGVAYDPADVQNLVRITSGNISKGIVFGVLDLGLREITWLEVPARTQRADEANAKGILSYLRRLRNKISIGELLSVQADARNMKRAESASEATETYTSRHQPTVAQLFNE